MLTRPTLAALVLASLTTGCAVGPDYVRPASPLPASLPEPAATQARPATAQTDLANWWTGFGDPQLTHLVELALQQNLDLAQAAARVTQARAGLSAADAAMLPIGGLSGQAARAHQSVETPLGQILNKQPGFDRYGNAYEVNAGLSWELDLFGGLRRNREAALADYQASEAGSIATRLAIAAQTADTYISIRGLQTRLGIARQQVRTQQELLTLARLLHSKGLAAELQVQQTEGALAQMQAAVPVMEAALEVTMHSMDILLGTLPGTHRAELSTAAAIPQAAKLSASVSPAEFLRRRPDLIAAERRLAAANARIGDAMSEYYPKLSLSGLIGSASSISGGNLFTSASSQASGVLGLRWRLFDFGRINAQIAQAKGQEAESLIAYRLAVLKATEDVENAYLTLLRREDQAAFLTQGVESLSKARNAAFTAYQKGVVSLFEVLDADQRLLLATDARTQAQTEAARASISVFRALGGGWQSPPDAMAMR